MSVHPSTGVVAIRGNLTPEYLSSLRKGVEHMRDHNIVLQDVRGEVTLALLDALHDARTAYLKVHGHDLQIACNEREALRTLAKDLEAKAEKAVITTDRWNTLRAWVAAHAVAEPGLAEYKRDLAHYDFLHHPQAPAAHEIIWPSVVARERDEDGIVIYAVTGMVFR